MNTRKQLLRTRLAFDYRVVMEMSRQSPLIDVQAFTNPNDLQKRRRPLQSSSLGGAAGYYLVRYDVSTLVRPDEYHTGFDVVFDLMAENSYPKKRDDDSINSGGVVATCVSRPMPWSPHFLDGVGTICLGSIWHGAEHTLLAHVIIHVARLLNWDEPVNEIYGGWNPEAVKWWRQHLDAKPITPGLRYPILPAELTHGVSSHATITNAKFTTENDTAQGFKVLSVAGPSTGKLPINARSSVVIRI